MKKLLIIVAVLVSTSTFAQRSFWSFNYEMSFATGEQKDFIESASFRGFGIDGRGFLYDNISLGGSFSWEVFNEIKRDLPPKSVDVADLENVQGDISGVQYRYLNTLPILFNGHYYLGSEGAVRPYFGLGIGTSYIEQKTEIGFVAFTGQKWGFALQPEVGVMIPFGLTGAAANVSGKFRYTTETSETDAISFFSLGIGLGFIN